MRIKIQDKIDEKYYHIFSILQRYIKLFPSNYDVLKREFRDIDKTPKNPRKYFRLRRKITNKILKKYNIIHKLCLGDVNMFRLYALISKEKETYIALGTKRGIIAYKINDRDLKSLFSKNNYFAEYYEILI